MTTVGYFEGLFEKYGDSPKALDWSEHGQRERFRVLWEAGIKEHHSVLDVGCGLGHFADYLEERDHLGAYEGVDASDRLLEVARTRRPEHYFSKVSENWLLEPLKLPSFDWVVSSGMLNVRPCIGTMESLIQRCFDASRVGCAINMLSARTEHQRRERFYYSPFDVLRSAMAITPIVAMRHDYLHNDFTIILRKQ